MLAPAGLRLRELELSLYRTQPGRKCTDGGGHVHLLLRVHALLSVSACLS